MLHHTGYTVSNLDRSLEFTATCSAARWWRHRRSRAATWPRSLGYPDAHVRMAHLRAPDSAHVIELFDTSLPRLAARSLSRATSARPHLCFIVADLEATYERLRAAGVDSFFSPPVEVDTGSTPAGSRSTSAIRMTFRSSCSSRRDVPSPDIDGGRPRHLNGSWPRARARPDLGLDYVAGDRGDRVEPGHAGGRCSKLAV